MTPVIETERLVLRMPEAADLPAWTAFFATERSRYVGGPGDAAKAWRVFASIAGHWTIRGYGIFVLTRRGTGEPVGTVGPWHPGDWPEAEIGWALWSLAAERQGYAAEAARAVITHAHRDLGWDTAVSYIDPTNARSIRLAERLGARLDAAADRPDAADLVYRHALAEAA